MRFRTLVAAVLLLCVFSSAQALTFPEEGAGVEALQRYIESVNLALDSLGAPEINSLFECYASFASLGVTAIAGADEAESNEIDITLGTLGPEWLEVSVTDTTVFASLCAALTAAAAGDGENVKSYLKDPEAYVRRVQQSPMNSFSDDIVLERGESVRTYFVYEPNAFGDGRSWLSMTLVFPREGALYSGVVQTPVPTQAVLSERDGSDDDGDYSPYDDGTQLEIFLTPTPEPDSAAGEEFR